MDHAGDDIWNAAGNAQFTSAQVIADACSAEPTCMGFNTQGWIKRTVTPRASSGSTVNWNPICLYAWKCEWKVWGCKKLALRAD